MTLCGLISHSITVATEVYLAPQAPAVRGKGEACEQTSGLAEAVAARFVQILKQSRPHGVQNYNSSSCQNCLLEPT